MLRKFVLLAPLLFLAACAEGELAAHVAKQIPLPGQEVPKTQGTFKVGKPYRVLGQRYTPRESYNFTETGIASWYGPNFHGKQTANGEIFDQNELTAAHRTLQMPSLVRVTNLENGRSLILRVNDRGPFKRGRIIDVSKRGAELLGFRNKGVAKVRVDVLPEESRLIAEKAKRGIDTRGTEVAANENRLSVPREIKTAPAQPPPNRTPVYQQASVSAPRPAVPQPVRAETLQPPNIPGHLKDGNFLPDPVVTNVPVSKTNIFVQAGSFGDQANASRYAQTLSQYGRADVYPALINNRQFYRVRFGPLQNVSSADALLNRLADAGKTNAIIIVD